MGLRKVAVTGGIACGKTTVCQIFRNLGARVVSADQIVHQLLSNDPQVKLSIYELLGDQVLEDGELNREKIAHAVFQNPKLLKALEAILHPRVLAEIDNEYYDARKTNAPLFIAEIPLLFEIGAEKNYDCTIAVIADEKIAKNRKPHLMERMEQQLSMNEKKDKADFVIYNNGTLDQLQQQAKSLYYTLQGEQ